MSLQLSNVRPDWEDIVSQLQSVLSSQASWQDVLTSSTGETLIEFIAAVGAYDQYSIESAFQECFPLTAKNDSSIYAIAQMLGVRLSRKAAAGVTVTISAPSPVTIPAYSQFTGAGSFFFNRDAISVTATPQTITLYQGQVQNIATAGLGTDYQIFITPETLFTVSDSDTKVALNGLPITVTRNGLWQLKGTPGVLDETMPDGRMAILFGNTQYGSKPLSTDVVAITYVVTSGADGNNLTTLNQTLSYTLNATVVCTATSNPSGGADEPSATVYKSVAAPTFGSFTSAVTAPQYKSTPFLYPGVVDAVTVAQRDINPMSLQRMNVVDVYLLTSSPWSQSQKDAFVSWYEQRTMFSTRFNMIDPVANLATVSIDVYCRNTALLNQIQQQVADAITALFAAQPGIVNRNIYRSDIIQTAMAVSDAIEFVILNLPATDLFVSRLPLGFPTLTAVAGGTLTQSKTYSYAVSYVSSLGGELAPANWRSMYLPAGGNASITVTWNSIPNAVNYKVWGRDQTANLGLLAILPANTLTFTDTGSVTPALPLLAESTQSVYYNKLNSLTVRTFFTARQPLVQA